MNNLDHEVFIYENKANGETNSHYLGLKLSGPKENKLGIGAKVELKIVPTNNDVLSIIVMK